MLATGHTLRFSGPQNEEDNHHNGVGLLLTNTAHKSLLEWEPINDRILRARFNSKFQEVTIIQCYAPTNLTDDNTKEDFYGHLQSGLDKVPKRDITIVMGDMNAKVGCNNTGKELIMGKQGVGDINENGELFTDFCELNDLVIGGTIFAHKDIHKVTWTSPDKSVKNQIDHLAILRRWRTTLSDVRAYRGAEICSDHELLKAKLQVRIARVRTQGNTKSPRSDITKLKTPQDKQEFSISLRNKFEALADADADSLENKWEQVKNTFTVCL
ncbi:craniofacial development protein 2-like [Dreissena polymorpha]|uniref:craniofacial development protein 2-like n=1 Tax=Dreissena polymorpha TaxID=45954 RepID=UPI002264DB14|nr:craniofacial development protein 2-like [Dreissena polymorpha]